jgi:hypothetical protein
VTSVLMATQDGLTRRRRRHQEFTPDKFRRSPKHYRFFAVEENVNFGDEAQVRRFNSDPDYADTHELRAVSLSYGDFESPAAARWIARMLNKAVGR